jgi:hypothetical protein
VTIAATVRAASPSALRRLENQVAELLGGLGLRTRPKYWFGLVVASQQPDDCLASPSGRAIVDNNATRLLVHLDAGAVRTAAEAFALTQPEQAALGTAGPGEALLLCAGQRQLITLVASTKERELFSTTPAELAARNRRRRDGAGAGADRRPSESAVERLPASAASSVLVIDQFDGADGADGTPLPVRVLRRRPHP